MKYFKRIKLKVGRECILRNGEEHDGQAVLANFILTHDLKAKTESSNEIDIKTPKLIQFNYSTAAYLQAG